MRYHLFQKFFGKMVKIKETSFLSTRGMTLMFGNCILHTYYMLLSLDTSNVGVFLVKIWSVLSAFLGNCFIPALFA